MRVYFDNVNFHANTGPNVFAKRLAETLMSMGHEIASHKDYDVALVFIEKTQNLRSDRPYVHRVDGFWFSQKDYYSKANDSIEEAYSCAKSVVFQSDFDKKFFFKRFGERNDTNVVLNGCELPNKRMFEVDNAFVNLKEQYDSVYVSASNWHPQKRFEENFRLYTMLRERNKKLGKNSCFVALGKNLPRGSWMKESDVMFSDSFSPRACCQLYAVADWMLHLAWLDHCPNVVVEALAHECQVACASSGGTSELIKATNGGIVLQDESFEFGPNDYDNPPKVPDLENLDLSLFDSKLSIDVSKVDVRECAKRYVQILEAAV